MLTQEINELKSVYTVYMLRLIMSTSALINSDLQ